MLIWGYGLSGRCKNCRRTYQKTAGEDRIRIRANLGMCTRSGELVIISRGKLHSKIKDKIKSLRFYVIVMIMCAAILPGAVAYFGVIKAYEARAVSPRLRRYRINVQFYVISWQAITIWRNVRPKLSMQV